MCLNNFFLIILAITVTQAAFAEEVELSKGFATCMDKSEGVTTSMLDCIAAETKAQDARLNKAYKELITQLTAKRKKQLQDAQRLWISYRDANCGFYADPDGGTMATVSAADCVMSMTAKRAIELESLKQPE